MKKIENIKKNESSRERYIEKDVTIKSEKQNNDNLNSQNNNNSSSQNNSNKEKN